MLEVDVVFFIFSGLNLHLDVLITMIIQFFETYHSEIEFLIQIKIK